MTKQPGDKRSCSRKLSVRHNSRSGSINRDHLAQQIFLLDGRIFLGHTVPSSDQRVCLARREFPHNAMNKQTSIPDVQDEITYLSFLQIVGLNCKAIAWPQ